VTGARSGDGKDGTPPGADDAAPRLARVTCLPGVVPAEVHWAEPMAPPPTAPSPTGEGRARPGGARSGLEAGSVDEPDQPDEPDAPEPASGERAARRAENVSMAALTRRGTSRRELERVLLARELAPDVVESELDRLERVGLIDDRALAETVVRTAHERKGLGRTALIAELRRRLVDQEHIDAALEQLDDDDEAERAGELAQRRARQLSSLDRETAVRRLTGYLARKGYSSSVVRTAVDEALAGHSGAPRRPGPRDTGGVRFR